jgi:hypothetical protein
MKNLSFSCAFCVEISGLLPAKPSLSSYLPVALRGDLLRKNTTHSVLESPARSKTLGKTWNLESNTPTIDKGLGSQPSAEKTSAAILHQQLLELGSTISGTHVAVNNGLGWGF